MREELLHYYERELTFLRRMGAEFAQRYPKVAGRLQLEPTKCEDPHVERIIEAFAFLAARVHLKIDDDFPEVSESIFNVVYPHYIRPIPSMSVVEFRQDPEQAVPPTGFRIKRHTTLYSRPVDGVPCKFRTCYETTLWPITVASAQWVTPDRLRPALKLGDAVAALRLELRCMGGTTFSQLDVRKLRLYLNGESNLVYPLYELLCNNARSPIVREVGVSGARPKQLTLASDALQPVGFGADEGMLPYPRRSFEAFRLLQEYFVFPEKYLFLDLAGFDDVRAAGLGSVIEVIIPIGPFERNDWRPLLEAGVNASTVKTGCSPIINLFPQVSEPVLLSQKRHEYPVVADARRRLTTEIFSVEDVTAITPELAVPLRFRPFYAMQGQEATVVPPANGRSRGEAGERSPDGLYWLAKRRASGWRTDSGTDIYLSFVDRSGRTTDPQLDAATVRLVCFNSDLPSHLPFGSDKGDFEIDGGGPVKQVVALLKPTKVLQPPLGGAQLWRLISQLSLNYLSLVDGGAEALREILRLYDFADSPTARRQIAGVVDVRSAPAFARIVTEHGLSFARGRRVELDLDEEEFTGGGVYLFCSILERFFGLYASINSFAVLTARTKQRKGPVREWAPRAGWKPLL
jgi:type VI secretion system protein ImpG